MVKLQSGREIELKPVSFTDKMKLFRLAQEYAIEHPKVKVSPEVFGEALICAGLLPNDLNTWDLMEVIEAGNLVFESLRLTESFKKK